MWRVLQRKVRTLSNALDGKPRKLDASRSAWHAASTASVPGAVHEPVGKP